MSLEETIAANTAAVLALTVALNKPLWLDPSVTASLATIASPPVSTTPVLDIVVPPAEQAKQSGVGTAVETTAPAATITEVLTAASILIANPAKGKAGLKVALEKAGVTKIKAISEVPADKFDAALAAINAAIAA